MTRKTKIVKTDGFHFDSENHVYTLDGRPMHGVTSILRVISKGDALINWAANMAVDYIEERWNPCEGMVEDCMGKTRGEIDAILKEARVAHRKKKEDAGAKGSDVHEQIENIVKEAIELNEGRMLPILKNSPDRKGQVKLFCDWALESNVRFIESEKRVYSQESWYAGTLDLVLEMNGKKYIADVKTSSAIYPEFYLQMAAYQGALEEMNEHLDISGAMVINLPKKGGFEIGMNFAYDDNRMAFLAALVLYKQLNSLTK